MSIFHNRELVVDNFAGWGGASTGIEQAIGRPIDIAINHDETAINMHAANHPLTRHFCESVWDINPREVVGDHHVGLGWFSPDCKHFSKAKGSKPVDKNIRGLAWVCARWAATVKPRVIMLENVEEFKTWGPLVDGKPCSNRKGVTFNAFYNTLKHLGYDVEFETLRACDYGAPTIRKRLFMIARRDKQPIIWPAHSHGKLGSGLLPYRTAAECIDWSIPCKSIFNRPRPLAENTLKRIAKGLEKFVFCESPFIAPANARVVPFITEHANASNQRNMSTNEPLRTICAQPKGGHFALVTAFLAKHYTGVVGDKLTNPLPTITAKDHNALVTSHMIKLRKGCIGHSLDEPCHTITAGGGHLGEVRAFLLKYYSSNIGHSINEPLQTITTKHRFGLVYVKGEAYQIVDIGMRMLEPHELALAQAFPPSYILDTDVYGNKMSKAKQVNGLGNSVSPVIPKAMVEENVPELNLLQKRAA
jgi:DNA (cytosine-5)-methyltransferase 1